MRGREERGEKSDRAAPPDLQLPSEQTTVCHPPPPRLQGGGGDTGKGCHARVTRGRALTRRRDVTRRDVDVWKRGRLRR